MPNKAECFCSFQYFFDISPEGELSAACPSLCRRCSSCGKLESADLPVEKWLEEDVSLKQIWSLATGRG